LAGKANSISTIYTLDIYRKYFNKEADEKKLIWIGRIVVLVSLVIAILVNWQDALGIGGKGGFEFIQKYTGYISPAIFPVFLFGLFWKKTTSKAAIAGILCGVVLAVLFDKFLPSLLGNETILYTAYPTASGTYEIPFLIQMGWVFFFTSLIIVLVSLLDVKGRAQAHGLEVDPSMFKISPKLLVMILIVLGIIGSLYVRFW
jgi:SSS family solute:Na+ symporter